MMIILACTIHVNKLPRSGCIFVKQEAESGVLTGAFSDWRDVLSGVPRDQNRLSKILGMIKGNFKDRSKEIVAIIQKSE